jgi:hypothetical protein
MKIKLTKKEMSDAEQAGNARWSMGIAAQLLHNKKVDKTRDPNEMEKLGVCAEIAVAKCLNIAYQNSLGIDSGADLWINDKLSIDVKFTYRPDGRLIFKTNKHFKSHFAVLVRKTHIINEFEIAGWASRTMFNEDSERMILVTPTSVFPNEKLLPIEKLIEIIETKNLKPEMNSYNSYAY